MEFKSISFVGSFPNEAKCPDSGWPEFAFIGRSNVGKSSLINMLSNQSDLAKVSGTPGKTRQLNFFAMDESWYLVDLPGYGYAVASKKAKANYERIIEEYLLNREKLMCAVVLIDSRHDLQAIDLEFVNWLGTNHVPFVIVFTKIDKLRKSEKEVNIEKIKASLLESWNSLPPTFVTSSKNKDGRDEFLNFVQETLDTYYSQQK